MKKQPLLSIITVNLNNLSGLEKTLKSVFEQTWQEFEFIVIDGGSTDGSKELIEEQKDRIDHWVSEPDKGVYNAMNKGIKAAKGNYLLFLNSGDHFYDARVLCQNYKDINLYDFVYFNIQVIGKKDSRIVSYPSNLRFSDFYHGTICHQAIFIKKELFNQLGLYDESLQIVADWKFIMEGICRFNCSYNKIDKILSTHYLDGLSSISQNRSLILRERKNILENEFKSFIHDIEELAEHKTIISNLRKSKKLDLLMKLGMLNKF